MTLPGAFEPDLGQWDAWSPEKVARVLAPVEAPWYVAAGWAIDLFLGGDYREHDDLEIAVPRDRFHEVVEALAGFELFVVGVPRRGFVSALEQARDALDATHQTWVREPETGLWRLDIMREPSDGDVWICRRDERIRLPYDEVIERTADGIPYGRPRSFCSSRRSTPGRKTTPTLRRRYRCSGLSDDAGSLTHSPSSTQVTAGSHRLESPSF